MFQTFLFSFSFWRPREFVPYSLWTRSLRKLIFMEYMSDETSELIQRSTKQWNGQVDFVIAWYDMIGHLTDLTYAINVKMKLCRTLSAAETSGTADSGRWFYPKFTPWNIFQYFNIYSNRHKWSHRIGRADSFIRYTYRIWTPCLQFQDDPDFVVLLLFILIIICVKEQH